MKKFIIYEAIEFLTDNGYSTSDLLSIQYKDITKNEYEFTAVSKKGHEMYINLDEGTVVVKSNVVK